MLDSQHFSLMVTNFLVTALEELFQTTLKWAANFIGKTSEDSLTHALTIKHTAFGFNEKREALQRVSFWVSVGKKYDRLWPCVFWGVGGGGYHFFPVFSFSVYHYLSFQLSIVDLHVYISSVHNKWIMI